MKNLNSFHSYEDVPWHELDCETRFLFIPKDFPTDYARLSGVRNFKALVNPTTNMIYNITTPSYMITKHKEAADAALEGFKNFSNPNDYKTKFSFDADGARMIMTSTFTNMTFNIGDFKDDELHPTIKVVNSYDGSMSFGFKFGAYRLICSNGLTIGKDIFSFSKKHVNELGDIISSTISFGFKSFLNVVDKWNAWSKITFSPEQMNNIIDELDMSKKAIKALREIKEPITRKRLNDNCPLSKWTFYNILTAFSTHNLNNDFKQLNFDGKIAGVIDVYPN